MNKERTIVQISLYAAVIAVLGLFPKFLIPVIAIPITFQSLGVMLAGAMLGSKKGALAVILFLFIVALGAPFLSGGRGGLGVFETPSVGFILGFPISAYAVGWLMGCLKNKSIFYAAVSSSLFGGVLILYLPGVFGLAIKANLNFFDAFMMCTIFLPGDVLKAVIVGFVVQSIHRTFPSAILSRS